MRNPGESSTAFAGKVAIVVAPLVVTFLLLVYRMRDFNAYREFVTEGGPIEDFTFATYVAASITAGAIAWRFKRDGQGVFGLIYLVLAAGLLFVAGEEVAWGQRLLGFESPEFFVTHNSHEETGVHNLGWANYMLIPVFTLVSGYGALGSFLIPARKRSRLKAIVPLFVPGKTLFFYFFLTFCFYAYLGYISPAMGALLGTQYDLRRGRRFPERTEPGVFGWEQETFELLMAAGFLFFTLENFWRQRTGQFANLNLPPSSADLRISR